MPNLTLPEMIANSADPDGAATRIATILEANPGIEDNKTILAKVVAVAASSRALSSAIAAYPHIIDGPVREDSVGLQVKALLFDIAGEDLIGSLDMRDATLRFSEAMDSLVDESCSTLREELSGKHPILESLPFAVIAMGKWAARELNYYSDIDLVFVHEPIPGLEAESRSAALVLASRLISTLSSPTFEGTALHVDADLRPEGSMGPLSRSLDSYRTYYEKWGAAWELQALLKARPVAGDAELGARFRNLADQIIWEQGLDVDALRSIRMLKSQAEDRAPSRDLKRSRGGIRDIEFAVQILQLVHGRFDGDLRVTSTLAAIEALGAHGYVEPEEATRLAEAYRFLRDVEHRIQLWDLQQTHELPDDQAALERIGRSLGFEADPALGLVQKLDTVRRDARDLHERLYFRPILESLVGVPTARLNPADAALRLEALGFADIGAATKAFSELTAGLSRKSRVMQQVMPLMLDWLSQSPDPDLGLGQLRLLLAHAPDHSALITLLQNNPLAGERLCQLLGTGRLLGDLLDRIPEFIPRLASDEQLASIRDREGATTRLVGLLEARPDQDARIGTIRRFVRRRKLRIAARDVLGEASAETTIRSLSDSADAAMVGALHHLASGDPTGFAVIAMGKWGGQELSYGSDLDLMYIYRDETYRELGLRLPVGLGQVLSEPSRHGEAYDLDADLRPEGRKGPMARSLSSFARYYTEWVEPWEVLALVKARPAAGEPELLADYMSLVEPVLWQSSISTAMLREIRSIKARVESERIPTGEDPDFHLKLGPGGLSDVEFVTQMLQLRHGNEMPSLRMPGTLAALRALREQEIISTHDHNTLHDAYLFCTRVRLRLHLQRGEISDSLPTDPAATVRLAASLGFDRATELREQYRRYTRRARRTFERLFYE